MTKTLILVNTILQLVCFYFTCDLYAIEVEGEVSGTWTIDDSPVVVLDTIFISDDDTLTIEAGVVVNFEGAYSFLVHGELYAEGTEEDSILFHPDRNNAFWGGIRADSGAVVTLEYCIVRDCNVGDEDTPVNGGALNIEGSELVLINCIFFDNRCSSSGGAVYSDGGSVLIINCVFTENISSEGAGGAIFLGSLTNRIIGNVFTENSSNGVGGALYIYTEAYISENSFISNSARSAGGAICTGQQLSEECIISGNTFIDNHSSNGGALAIGHLSSVVVHHNIFSRNVASFMGGGILLNGHDHLMQFYSNTVTFNEGGEWGGGISVSGNTSIRPINCIIRGNNAENGPQISFYEEASEVFLSYCNIEGDWPEEYGEHVIHEDPLFTDPDNNDFHLTEDSPCIDAGDPEADLDPDGTVADIGPFYFHQRDIEINPDTLLFETPDATDSAFVTIRNIGLTTLTISSQSITPDFSPFSVTDSEFEIEPESEHTTWIMFAPGMAGEYEAVLTIASDDPDEEAVEVQIIGTALDVNDHEDNTPVDFRIIDVYPNPFNSILQVTLSLPNSTSIDAQILDLTGRKTADLYSGNLTAGKHQLTWKADKQASGIYLLHVSSGRGETDIQKVILVR